MNRSREIILRLSSLAISLLAISSPLACTGVDPDRGLDEPLRVNGATFEQGELPGAPPLAAGAPPDAAKADPYVTVIESVNNVFSPGQNGKTLSGRTTENAAAIALRFADLGSGYWVVPAGGLDPVTPGERLWSLAFEVAGEVPPGLHPLRIAAVDKDGEAGTQAELAACVTSPIPDNLNACDATIEPPAAVLSLSWDSDADLDLGVVLPSGKLLDAKHPTTATGDPPAPDQAKDGAIDRDANAACTLSQRRENVVWPVKPADGTYLVYVNMFEACAAQAARFTVGLYLREKRADGSFALVHKLGAQGEIFAEQQNGGAAAGLYVTTFEFQ